MGSLTPGRARWLVAVLAFLAYLPALGGDFLEIDDPRFVVDNEAIHSITPGRYFTDAETIATVGWEGTYRPLRTLDFSLDWALSGGSAWLFHTRNILYHVLGSLLVLALFHRIVGNRESSGTGTGAVMGALVFALHPVTVESVAWITSRADVLLLCLFVGALILHLDGRRLAAAVVLVLACLAKESAVVFPAIAILLDRFRREKLRYGWYGAYGGVALAYLLLRHAVVGSADHLDGDWWGGSYAANLGAMARGVLAYAQLLLFPVGQTIDYHVPATTGLDLGAVLGMGTIALAALAAVLLGREVRLGLAWFAVTMLPMSNLAVAVGIPTAERFLYVPLVGLALIAGRALARFRLRWAVVACLLVLTLSRSHDWRDTESLLAANGGISTPRGLDHRSQKALERAHLAAKAGDRSLVTREAAVIVDAASGMLRLYEEEIGLSAGNLGARVLVRKANVLLLLDRHQEALDAAREAAHLHVDPYAYYNAGLACIHLERAEEAADSFERAIRSGYDESDLRPTTAGILNLIGRERARLGRRTEALGFFRRSRDLLPDPVLNREAHDMIRRLGGLR